MKSFPHRFRSIFTLAFATQILLLASCMSTREYVKTTNRLYQDDILIAESETLTLDGKLKSSKSTQFYDCADVCSKIQESGTARKINAFTATNVKNLKKSQDEITFTLMQYESDLNWEEPKIQTLGTKVVKVKDGKIQMQMSDDGNRAIAKGDSFDDELEEFFNDNAEKLVEFVLAEESNGFDSTKTVSKTECEKVVVNSTPNGKYIFYQIAGKPFVIAGVTAWNILKCAGYAFINFGGGYNAATGNSGGGKLWYMPSWKKAKEKSAKAREENRIKHYPEYHLPFTNNTIVVDKYDRDITVLSKEDGEVITPIEHMELANTMEVTLSAKADAAATAAVAGAIGTGVTIPVSVATWIGGAVTGVMAQVK